jgi:hypothetical protein
MEQFLRLGKLVSDLVAIAIGGVIIYWGLKGKRRSSGVNPRNPPLPVLLVKTVSLVGGTYIIFSACIEVGLDLRFLQHDSWLVLALAKFNRHIGATIVQFFLFTWFALFGISMGRLLFGEKKTRVTRIFGFVGLLASILVMGSLSYLIFKLFRNM